MEPPTKCLKLDGSIVKISPEATEEVILPHKDARTTEPGNITSSDEVQTEDTNDLALDGSEEKEDERTESTTEEEAGISQYMSDHEGFCGTLKARWEDFIVHEVAPSGQVVHLTTCNPPEEPASAEEPVATDGVLSEEMLAILNQVNSGEKDTALLEASDDKEERTRVHQAIKVLYPRLCGKTESVSGKRMFVVKKNTANERTRRDKRQGQGRYCQFVLYKEGKDTMGAISLITRTLRSKSSLVTFAGTKDRRAITSQLMTYKGMDASHLASVNKCLRDVHVGNFEYVDEPLKLGQLKGNRFSLVIRDVVGTDAQIKEAVESLGKNGFVNYFGLQRFGGSSVPNHEVGKAILKSDWVKVIDLILQPTKADLPYFREWKSEYQRTGDAQHCYQHMPHCLEKTLLEAVAKHGKTLNAIEMLPRHMRQLYLHSYQSLLWNRVASRRLATLGKAPVLGDLLWNKTSEEREDVIKDSNAVRALTEKDLASTQLGDVVLTVPGFDVAYPENIVNSWFDEILAESDLERNSLKHRVKDFSLPGSYRSLVVVPQDVTYEVVSYTNPLLPLIQSDMQALKGETIKRDTDGPHRALILEFNLPKSSYATMAVRELIKQVKVKR